MKSYLIRYQRAYESSHTYADVVMCVGSGRNKNDSLTKKLIWNYFLFIVIMFLFFLYSDMLCTNVIFSSLYILFTLVFSIFLRIVIKEKMSCLAQITPMNFILQLPISDWKDMRWRSGCTHQATYALPDVRMPRLWNAKPSTTSRSKIRVWASYTHERFYFTKFT